MKEEEKDNEDLLSFAIFLLVCAAIIVLYSLIHEIYINLNK
jgi:hypothetical protein